MARLDLDATRRARQEKENEPHELVLGGQTFPLPSTPPAAILVGIGRMQKGELSGLEDALRAMFGDKLDEALAAGFEMNDFEPIFTELYGLDVGESEASGS